MSAATVLTIGCDVVGVMSTPGYPETFHRLRELEEQATGDEPIAAVVLREPTNAHDPNAVAVHVPAIGPLGHLSRDDAAVVAPLLDSGHRARAEVVTRIHPDHPDKPGVTLLLELLAPSTPDKEARS